MSKPKLVDPRDTTGLDVSSLLSLQHRAHLALMGPKFAMFHGWQMKEGDEGEEDEDEDEDDALELELTDLIKVGDKTMTVAALQKIGATEKRQGKKAGQKAVLDALGFDTIEAAKAALKKVPSTPPKKKTGEDEGEDESEAEKRAAARETAAEERERKADEKARKADLKSALAGAGVKKADLDDALAILDRAVDAEYDEDDLDEAVEALQERRPALFGDADDEDDETEDKPKAKAAIPSGRPKRRNKPESKPFGAGGLARAERMGFITKKD